MIYFEPEQPPVDPRRRPTPWPARVAALVLIFAAPVATWWLVGPNPGDEVSFDPMRADDWDYLWHPLAIDPGLERAVGIVAVCAVVASLALIGWTVWRNGLDRRWWLPFGALVAVAAFVGAAERVVTAAVVGANIGGGFVIMMSPVLLIVVLVALVRIRHILRTTEPTAGGSATS